MITAEEIARTHKVRSRISHAQRDWFIRTAVDAPWAAVPIDAQLVDADPHVSGELYDRAEALYDHFRTAAPRHVGVAKISKVLHLKRPGLFPILDSKVMAFYRLHARAAAARYPHRGRRAMFWAAIRDDVCANLDSGGPPAAAPPPGAVRDRAGPADRKPDRCASARPADLGRRLKSDTGIIRDTDCWGVPAHLGTPRAFGLSWLVSGSLCQLLPLAVCHRQRCRASRW